MCTPPIGIESEKTILFLIKTPMLVIFSPRSIIVAPCSRSSIIIVAKPDASGVIMNLSTNK